MNKKIMQKFSVCFFHHGVILGSQIMYAKDMQAMIPKARKRAKSSLWMRTFFNRPCTYFRIDDGERVFI